MLLGVNVPVPPLQIPVVVAPEIVPDNTVAKLFLQIFLSVPAFTVGGFVKITIILSLACKQLPLPVELKYNLICPALKSAALGI